MVLISPFTTVFNALTTMILNIIGYKRGGHLGFIYNNVGDLFLIFFLAALLPAVFEEFTHRGILLSGLEDRGSEMSAVVLSAVCFGLMHTNPLQFIYAVVGGLVFGAAVTKTGSILPAMCAHFANNAVAMYIDYSLQKENKFAEIYLWVVESENILSFAFLVAALAFSVFGVVWILQYLARKTEKPVSEKKLFGILPMDVYKPNGKATLKDNAVLIATMISEGFLLAVMIVWVISLILGKICQGNSAFSNVSFKNGIGHSSNNSLVLIFNLFTDKPPLLNDVINLFNISIAFF